MTELVTVPVTRTPVSRSRADVIRNTVRKITSMPTDNDVARLAAPEDAELFYAFLKDPAVHGPIYSLPTELNTGTVGAFIQEFCDLQAKGEGFLFLNFNAAGEIGGYTDATIWPDWAAGELGGAIHPDRQGKRNGIAGAKLIFSWMFEALDLDVICETGALDNIRTARLLETVGFRLKGETLSTYDDGRKRASRVWEVTREEWRAFHAA